MKNRTKMILIAAAVAAVLFILLTTAVAAPATDQSDQTQTRTVIYPDGLDQVHVGHPVYTGEFVTPGPRPDYGIGPGTSTNTSVYTSPATQMLEASNTPYVMLNVVSSYTATGTVIKVNVPAMQVNGTYVTKRNMDIQYGANGTQVPFWIDSYRGNLDNNSEANFVYLKANIVPGNNTFLIFWNNSSQPGVNDGSAIFKYNTGYSEITGDQIVELSSGRYNTLETDMMYFYNRSNWTINRDPSPYGLDLNRVPLIRLNKTSVFEITTLWVAFNNTTVKGTAYANQNYTWVVPTIKNASRYTNGSPWVLGSIRMWPDYYPGTLNGSNRSWNVTVSVIPINNNVRVTYTQNGAGSYADNVYNNSTMVASDQSVQTTTPSSRMGVFSIWASNGVYPNSYINYALLYNSTPVTYTISTNSSIPVSSISVNGYSTVRINSDYYYYATVLPTLAKQQVTWSVNNTSVATIDTNTGLLTPLSEGTVLVTATATDGTGITGSMLVTVIVPQQVSVTQTTGGTVSVSSASAFTGDSVSITATPSSGYALSSVSVVDSYGNEVPVVNNVLFVMPDTAVTVSAEFVAVDYAVNVMQAPGGTVSADPAGGNAGQVITLSATPSDGYEITGYIVQTENGIPVTVTGNTFILPAANVSVTPQFSLISYSVSVTQAANGTITASPVTASAGDTVTISNNPEAGFMLESYNVTWSGGEISVRNGTFTMPAGNVSVTGTFMRSVPVAQIQLENGTGISIGRHAVNFTSNATNGSYLFLWQTSYDGFETIAESGFVRAESQSFMINATRTGIMQIRMSPAEVMFFTTVVVTIYDRLSDFENLSYDGVFNQYFSSQNENLSGWDVLELPRSYYYETVTPFIFWTIIFAVVYTALYITTGGAFIPAAAFSAVGAILVNVMPLELSVWGRVLISIGLFVVPAYKYFKQRGIEMIAKTELKISKPESVVTQKTFSDHGPYIAVPGQFTGSSNDGAYFEENKNGRWKVMYFFKIFKHPTEFTFSSEATMETLQNLSNSGWTLISGEEAKAKHNEILKEWTVV